jgi:hypothetical protein
LTQPRQTTTPRLKDYVNITGWESLNKRTLEEARKGLEQANVHKDYFAMMTSNVQETRSTPLNAKRVQINDIRKEAPKASRRTINTLNGSQQQQTQQSTAANLSDSALVERVADTTIRLSEYVATLYNRSVVATAANPQAATSTANAAPPATTTTATITTTTTSAPASPANSPQLMRRLGTGRGILKKTVSFRPAGCNL